MLQIQKTFMLINSHKIESFAKNLEFNYTEANYGTKYTIVGYPENNKFTEATYLNNYKTTS